MNSTAALDESNLLSTHFVLIREVPSSLVRVPIEVLVCLAPRVPITMYDAGCDARTLLDDLEQKSADTLGVRYAMAQALVP